MQNPPPGPPQGEGSGQPHGDYGQQHGDYGQQPGYQPPPSSGGGYQPPPSSGGGYEPPQSPGAGHEPPSGGGYQQPPSYQSSNYQGGQSSSGMDSKTGCIIAYVLTWLTGLIMFFVGKDNRDVRYHGAQSLIFFGGLTVLLIGIDIIGGILVAATSSTALSVLFGLIVFVIVLFDIVMWIICLVKAIQSKGERWQIPLVGGIVTPYAERMAGS